MSYPTMYRTVSVDGLPIFYREAGDRNAPVILLLHGFPSSSRMYEPLLTRLSDRYRLIAPTIPASVIVPVRRRRSSPIPSTISPR
jgi:pimeloyl-ACP methyl ester carboxylesterase